jgi:hypothetical protein
VERVPEKEISSSGLRVSGYLGKLLNGWAQAPAVDRLATARNFNLAGATVLSVPIGTGYEPHSPQAAALVGSLDWH